MHLFNNSVSLNNKVKCAELIIKQDLCRRYSNGSVWVFLPSTVLIALTCTYYASTLNICNKKCLNKKLDSRLKDFLAGSELWNPKFFIFTTPRMVADPLLHRVPEYSLKKSRVSTRAMVFLIQNVRCNSVNLCSYAIKKWGPALSKISKPPAISTR